MKLLPDSVFDQHIAVTGKVGSGKSYTVRGFVERLLINGRRVCVIDPTGAWHGLRSSADGKRAGFPVVVFGGDHGDVPITAESAAPLARMIAELNLPCVIDVSGLLIGEQRQFMAEFAEKIFQLNRKPLHLVIDEADIFAPQNPQKGDEKMLHRVDRIVRRGRIRGFRVTLISQRPAVLHKNVLTQANVLITMRLTAPQDRKALEEWIKGQGDTEKGRQVLASLASLPTGEGWAWAPELEILERMKFPRITTFDSGRTPDDDGEIQEPVRLADVDLTEINAALADAIKEAAENDPKLLRKEIARLKREAASVPAAVAAEPDPTLIERARQEAFEEGAAVGRAELFAEIVGALDEMERQAAAAVHAFRVAIDGKSAGPAPVAPPRPLPRVPVVNVRPAPRPRVSAGPGAKMPKAERQFLTVLAQRGALSRNKIAIFAGYSVKSGHIDNTLASLRSQGFAAGGNDATSITDAGLAALGSYDPLPTGADLHRYWIDQLDKASATFLTHLIKIYPRTVDRNGIAEVCGYSAASGHIDNTLAKLRSLDLATGRNDAISAAEHLFE